MHHYDVIIVGGGPAGSTCAARLRAAGIRVAVLDLAEFPRLKLCAGWVTPEVFDDLGIKPEYYPHRLNTFDKLRIHIKGLTFNLKTTQHSIRRFEFDDFLLKRCGADIFEHSAKRIQRKNGKYLVDDKFSGDFLVGAGGTRCPVYRTFFRSLNPRAQDRQIVAYELEFPYNWSDPRCHLWFIDNNLPGYSWYVPKEHGYLNCGVGGFAEKIKSKDNDIKMHWGQLVHKLKKNFMVTDWRPDDAHGYSYFMRSNVNVLHSDNAFIIGDAAGLATLDLGEGIGPAVQSAHLATDAILNSTEYSLDAIHAYSPIKPWLRKWLEGRLTKKVMRGKKHSSIDSVVAH
ncbi:MAG: NAD(P)/FAD-dependent oxidoreductase [Gammaproteobacteria bacterium]